MLCFYRKARNEGEENNTFTRSWKQDQTQLSQHWYQQAYNCCKIKRVLTLYATKLVLISFCADLNSDKDICEEMFLPEQWTKNSLMAFTSCQAIAEWS